jgi:transposase InsO family protein/transposase-like protein
MRAIALYIHYNRLSATTIRELGYPSRKALYRWYREYEQSGDLHGGYRKTRKYSALQKQAAVAYYFEHGRSISATIRAVGYPSREMLGRWIDEYYPGSRKVPIKQGSAVSFSEEQKRRAVIALCSRDSSAESVAVSVGVSRQALYLWKNRLLAKGVPASMRGKKGNEAPEDRDELIREIEMLQKQLHKLQLEHEILKKANELLKKDAGINPQDLTNQEKTLLIDALKPTYRLSELLTHLQMPRSSYFYHRVRLRLPEKHTALRQLISDVFKANDKRYGYRRVHKRLQRDGVPVSEKIVRRIMAEENLVVSGRRRRRYSSYAGEISAAVENVIERDFHAEAPNEKWLTDITEFQLPAGKVYLSPMIDCYDGMVVSWTIGTSPDAELVNAMLDRAIAGLTDGEHPIIHSDRGSHYRWPGWISRMEQARLTRSMSSKGCTPDNAACEGFFGRLKNEMYYDRPWNEVSIQQFIDLVDQYIGWYNKKRIKLSLGGLSPAEYRQRAAA